MVIHEQGYGVVQQGAWLSMLGLAEIAGVLSSVYEFTPAELVRAIEVKLITS